MEVFCTHRAESSHGLDRKELRRIAAVGHEVTEMEDSGSGPEGELVGVTTVRA